MQVDPDKVAILEAPYGDFRKRMNSTNRLRALAGMVEHQFRPYYFLNPPRWRIALRAMNHKSRMKASFVSIGAVRSGTSLLSSYILQHPHVAPPLAKELVQFPQLKYMEAQLPSRREQLRLERRYGGATTGYFTPIAPDLLSIFLMKALCQDGCVVVILRDPIDRAFSQWRWDRMRNSRILSDPLWRFVPDFETLAKIEREAICSGGSGPSSLSGNRVGYLQQSIYLPFLRLLFDGFPRDRVFIVDAAQMFRDPARLAKDVYAFLGLPYFEPMLIRERNSAPEAAMSERLRSELSEFFRPYNEALYEFLGIDFGWE
ncbi:MAG: hypothetical protein C3F11_06615 [Methylocystaceae bacterium]|nr:MAG: hypothetical protein C3F11_06615 [Methylocystaceae bacterium]